METLKEYWKSLVAIALVAGFIWFQHSTIKDLRKDNAQLELKLTVSNQSIDTLQKSLMEQNNKIQEIATLQAIKQGEVDDQMQKLQQENHLLQTQLLDIMNAPETGNECEDIKNLLRSVGE